MKYHHKSHHIFAFLGALLLIFVVFFGIQFFQQQYTFESVALNNNSSYEDGVDTTNPFLPHPDESSNSVSDNYNWITFGSTKLSFLYPDQYALRVSSGTLVSIIPPLLNTEKEDCSSYKDEQRRALCLKPDLSPHITLRVGTIDDPWSPGMLAENIQDLIVNGMTLKKNSYQDEYGGTTSYRMIEGDRVIEVLYRHVDTPGGMSFSSLHKKYGNQYQLTAVEQDKLAIAIMKSIELK